MGPKNSRFLFFFFLSLLFPGARQTRRPPTTTPHLHLGKCLFYAPTPFQGAVSLIGWTRPPEAHRCFQAAARGGGGALKRLGRIKWAFGRLQHVLYKYQSRGGVGRGGAEKKGYSGFAKLGVDRLAPLPLLPCEFISNKPPHPKPWHNVSVQIHLPRAVSVNRRGLLRLAKSSELA